MEFEEENPYMRASKMPPPSRIPSPGKFGLAEITDSQNNIRSKPSMLPPPTSFKHKLSGYSEPEPKRKTLVERAGEPRSIATATPGPRSFVKGQSLVGANTGRSGQSRNTSNSSSISRAHSVSSRNTSNGSFSSSVGPGRPATSYGNRPQSSMAFSQSTTSRPVTSLPKSRPATSMDMHNSQDFQEGTRDAFDVRGKLEYMEASFEKFKEFEAKFNGTAAEKKELEDMLAMYKNRINEAENLQSKLTLSNATLQDELDAIRHKADMLQQQLLTSTTSFNEQILSNQLEITDLQREHRKDIEKLRRENADEADRLDRQHREKLRDQEQRANSEIAERVREVERRCEAKLEEKLEDERSRSSREIQDLQSRIAKENTNLDLELQKKNREIDNMRGELEEVKGQVDREQTLKNNIQEELNLTRQTILKTNTEHSSTISSLEATVASLRARIHFLESGSKAQSDSFADMEARLQEAVKSAEESRRKLIKEETLRRILFNQVQELKGNIRVMCRVRPASDTAEGDVAKLTYPDVDKESKELEILGKEEKSSLGKITRKTHAFTFDRVFRPESQNQEVFEEISQLVQSALDGYNVCIFAYGQTGAGKTHTMSSADGMIPRATQQIYETATNLKEKGWTYTMEGSFVEVYNEEIHDLLGGSKDFDKTKHEIRHDDQRKQTVVTGLKTVMLDSPDTVESMMKQAANNRSVAATKSNERSSRSHSVFILKLVGRNSTTNETSEGTLNLVDLAGSERLKQSGAEGDRMKETQNINKSLSCLGDVIGALGQGKEGAHIPYRNSKLTYLLQYSLGGNSKTLMFVMTSPLEAHLSETLTSLKFATKVHNTHIGTAKKTKKVTERSNDS